MDQSEYSITRHLTVVTNQNTALHSLGHCIDQSEQTLTRHITRQVQRYGRMWLCGPYLPSSFLTQTSKYSRLSVKFRSNEAVTRFGFRAVVTATGTVNDVKDIVNQDTSVVDEIKELINFGDSLDEEETTIEPLVDNSSLQREHRGF